VTVIALFYRLSRRQLAAVAVVLTWLVVSVLPVYHFFYVAPTLEGSRYLYLGTAAFALLLVQLAATAPDGRPTVVASLILCGAIAAGSAGVWIHQRPWVVAGAQREAVLRAARDTLATSRCSAISVSHLPDSFEGAFVFRNGFREALTLYGITTPPVRGDAACGYRWTGTGFEAVVQPN
jgi:hypothetical protein